MTSHDTPLLRFHEDAALFRESINFTAATTGFLARLIEKDYFCSVLLEYIATNDESLIFKGGTCLTKVHADFYRLSEDLDFAISMPLEAQRRERSQRAKIAKDLIQRIPRQINAFRLKQPLTGSNNSTQYVAAVEYPSLAAGSVDQIKIEISLREPVIVPVIQGQARTLLRDPISNVAMAPQLAIASLSKEEAFAEKFRAALTRREAAIRDFFDIDHAVRRMALNTEASDFVAIVQQKLRVPGNDAIDVSDQRFAALQRQLEAQLKSVLRAEEFEEFDLARAFTHVANMAAALETS